MDENELGKIIVDSAFQVHTQLGPGLLESVYEVVLTHEIRQRGFDVERQVPIPIVYSGLQFDEGFRIDFFVNQKVIIEVKSVEETRRVHSKQLLTYLKLANIRLGYLINFGADLIKDGISRVVNNAEDWGIRGQKKS